MQPNDIALTPVDAAKMIYRTEHPTADQVCRVVQEIERGELRGKRNARHRWTTSASQVAEYLARHAVQEAGRRSAAMGVDPGSTSARQLNRVYHDILRDYFLAVVLRRKFRHRPPWFDRAVTVGQILCLTGVFAALAAVGWLGFSPEPSERQAVTRWLTGHVARYRIKKWHPMRTLRDDEVCEVRVEYEYYSAGGRSITTDRVFLVEEGRVKSVQDDE